MKYFLIFRIYTKSANIKELQRASKSAVKNYNDFEQKSLSKKWHEELRRTSKSAAKNYSDFGQKSLNKKWHEQQQHKEKNEIYSNKIMSRTLKTEAKNI